MGAKARPRGPRQGVVVFETAACAQPGAPPADDFYLDQGAEPPAEVAACCARCPVRLACLEAALANREPHGVWGGLTPSQRLPLQTYRSRVTAA